MIKLTYNVSLQESDNEMGWLKGMKVFPATRLVLSKGRIRCAFGMIVDSETASVIKLKHAIVFQEEYHQK